MAGIPVSEFFASLGFKVDTSGADNFNNYLNNLEKRIRAVRAEAIKLQRTLQNTAKIKGGLKLDTNRQQMSAAKAVSNLNSAAASGTAKIELYSSKLDRLANSLNKVAAAAGKVNLPQGSISVRTPGANQTGTRPGRPSSQFGFGIGLGGSMNQFVRNMLPFAGASLGAAIVKSAVQQGRALEAAKLSIIGTSPTVEVGQQNIQFVNQLVDRLKMPLAETMEQFSRLNAASQGTKLEGQGVRDVITGVMEFGRARNVDPERMALSIRAIGQMMGKGQIMMEELKNQFSEHLPGAMQLSAKAMGMTVKELYAAVEAGEVMAEDFLPKLAAEMAKVARQNNALNNALATSRAAQQGFNTEIARLAEKIYRAVDPVLARLFDSLANWVSMIDGEAVGRVLSVLIAPFSALANIFENISRVLAEMSNHWKIGLGVLALIIPFIATFAGKAGLLLGVIKALSFVFTPLRIAILGFLAALLLLDDVLEYAFGDGMTDTVTRSVVNWLKDLWHQVKVVLSNALPASVVPDWLKPNRFSPSEIRDNDPNYLARSQIGLNPSPLAQTSKMSMEQIANVGKFDLDSMLKRAQNMSVVNNQQIQITVQGNMDQGVANKLPGLLGAQQALPVPFPNRN